MVIFNWIFIIIGLSFSAFAGSSEFFQDLLNTHQSRLIVFSVNDIAYRAVILETDPKKLSAEDVDLLKRARRTVFKHFKLQAPNYSKADWDRVRRLDPLYSPGTFALIIENLETSEIVGNMKMVYDHRDRKLPAEKRFPGKYKRDPIQFANTNLFNILTGKVEHYGQSEVGGAVQIMELYGKQMAPALFMLANMVLVEHPHVDYITKSGSVRRVRPSEIVSYGDGSEMGRYNRRIGLEVIADDNGYLLSKMSIDKFKSLYRANFLFRPGSIEMGKMGLLFQISSHPLRYIHVDNILTDYSSTSHYSGNVQNGYTTQFNEYISDLRRYFPNHYDLPTPEMSTISPVISNLTLYLSWARENARRYSMLGPLKSQCFDFYGLAE